MNIKNTMLRASRGSAGKKKRMPDYRKKLNQTASAHHGEDRTEYPVAKPADQVRRLTDHSEAGTLAFQSVLVAALKAMDRVLRSERQAAHAAISLGQQEKLHEMVQTVELTIDALSEMLTPQGDKMLGMNATFDGDTSQEGSWWFALTEAQRANAESADWMRSVVAGQPEEGLAYELSRIITNLLRQHDNVFLGEAEKWIN